MSGRVTRKGLRHFRVEGTVKGIGEIREYCWAMTDKQAVWVIARRLEKRIEHRIPVYVGDCTVTDITGNKQWNW